MSFTPKKPLENEEKFSEIFLMSYQFSSGGVSLCIPTRERSLAYCKQPPHEVFKILFPKYHVTNYNGCDLFNEEDLEENKKSYGIGISAINPVLVGGASLEKVLQLDELNQLKRENPLPENDVKRFFTELNKPDLNSVNKKIMEKQLDDFNKNKGFIPTVPRDKDYI